MRSIISTDSISFETASVLETLTQLLCVRLKHSIRVDDRRRICLRRSHGAARELEMVDYQWLRLQAAYDLEVAQRQIGARVAREVKGLRQVAR